MELEGLKDFCWQLAMCFNHRSSVFVSFARYNVQVQKLHNSCLSQYEIRPNHQSSKFEIVAALASGAQQDEFDV